jgi:hypothetical protein
MDARTLRSQLGEQAAGVEFGIIGVRDQGEDGGGHGFLQ